MTHFIVQVLMLNSTKEHWLQVEPAALMMDIIKHLSLMEGVKEVRVVMHARTRYVVQRGEVVKSHPDLTSFYTTATPDMVWDWTACGKYTQ